MKKVILLIVCAWFFTSARAQFTLSGRIKNYTGAENIKINIPLIYGYNRTNDTIIRVAKDGSFSVVLPLPEQKFADLIFQRKFYTYLLTPGKSLVIECNAQDSLVKVLQGSSAVENQLLTTIDLQEYPIFMAKPDLFAPLLHTLDDVKAQIENPWLEKRNAKLRTIQSATISDRDKLLIIEELNATTIITLNNFLQTGIADRALVESSVLALYEPIDIRTNTSVHGPNYYAMMRSYLGYLEKKALANRKKTGLKDNEPLDYYKISIDSGNRLAETYGNSYLRWIVTKNSLPLPYLEKLTYQEIANLYEDKDMKPLLPLVKEFKSTFPQSKILPEINRKVTELKNILEKNFSNRDIQIVADYKSIKSIAEILKPLQGKVVYLDIWGTWCGPCKWEIPFIPALKSTFKGKNVAYVYLDMDEDAQDLAWKDFIRVNGMEGLHIRKTRAEIAAFWDELNVKKEDRAYPRYFIFDKSGKLVVDDAFRPSNGAELYKQITTFLEK